MPTLGSITKTIRINPKDLEVIEGLMEDGTSWSGAIHKLCQNAVNHSNHADLEVMCGYLGVSEGEFIRMVSEAVVNGEIVYEDGKLVKKAQP